MSATITTSTPDLVLKRAHLAVRDAFHRAFAVFGISVPQVTVLHLLDDEPGMSGAELARRCSVTAPSMSEMIAGLERTGLISRDPAPGGRGLLAHLTPAGQATIARCAPLIDQVRTAVFSGIDPARLAIALEVLEQVADAAGAFDEGVLP